MNTLLWNKTVEFHGHACPGLAIGFQVSMLTKKVLEIQDNIDDEDIVCISETDACGVDAIQVILKATIGTGALKIDYKGKQAFNIYNRKNGKSARFVLKDMENFSSKEERMKYILSKEPDELFTIKNTIKEFPERAKIYDSYICDKCGEKTAANAIDLINGKYICTSCLGK